MNHAPVLSIVIVNWNTRALLLALLDRLLTSPRLATEVIVVDNQSRDDSVAAARHDFPDAIVLPQPVNGGFAYGVNRGIERATGDWILLLNTDAEATWDDLEHFVAAAEREPDAAVFGPRIVDQHGVVQASSWRRHRPRDYLPNALGLGRLLASPQPTVASDVDCVSGCVFLIRRSVLTAVGGFDERYWMYYEEADFCERVRRAGHRVRWLPDATFVHAGGLSAAQSAERTFLAFRDSCLCYHAVWHGRLATEWVRACLVLGHTLRLAAWCLLAMAGRGGRARLYWRALGTLLRPGYVAEVCRRPKRILSVQPATPIVVS